MPKDTDIIKKLIIPNAPQKDFREALKKIEKGQYEVETLVNGNKIHISKPGFKGKDDFRVDIFDPNKNKNSSLTHEYLFDDIAKKYQKEPVGTKKLVCGLLDVCNGKEPDKVIKDNKLKDTVGLSIDVILKNYKWIWGQEDCNYPQGKGRWLSMDALLKEYEIEKP
ncbi:hypothetical protein [Treponema primitia]|uniref:hypothetical protein n=1 Tax=Treponema primitia TaxID=88058 RepID=UPI0002554DEA|nr:hypothetical protein [Treponema primitia]